MNEAARAGFTTVRSESQRHFATQDLECSGHRRGMGRQLFPGSESEEDDLGLLIVVQRVTQNSLRRNLNLTQNILGKTVGAAHHRVPSFHLYAECKSAAVTLVTFQEPLCFRRPFQYAGP